jgi:hypothetical protein
MFGIVNIRNSGNRLRHAANINFSENGIGWNLKIYLALIKHDEDFLSVLEYWRFSNFVSMQNH